MDWTVGELTVHRVDEVPLPPATGAWLLPAATPEVVVRQDRLRPDFADEDGVLRLASHSFAVTSGTRRILVDTGIGNGKQRANPAWDDLHTDYLDRLAEAGGPPESVDLVVHTHLHADHVGWNTRLVDGEWVPTFPHARHLVSRVERVFWAGYAMDGPRRQMFRDSVLPVEDAGRLDLVDVGPGGVEIAPGVSLVPTPGHTPGHVSVRLDSGGRTAVITGDCIHHPVQVGRPDIGSCVDVDPGQAARARRALLADVAGTDTLLLGTHFPAPTAGRVVADGGGLRWVPVHRGPSSDRRVTPGAAPLVPGSRAQVEQMPRRGTT